MFNETPIVAMLPSFVRMATAFIIIIQFFFTSVTSKLVAAIIDGPKLNRASHINGKYIKSY
jgi:hypothetical protein